MDKQQSSCLPVAPLHCSESGETGVLSDLRRCLHRATGQYTYTPALSATASSRTGSWSMYDRLSCAVRNITFSPYLAQTWISFLVSALPTVRMRLERIDMCMLICRIYSELELHPLFGAQEPMALCGSQGHYVKRMQWVLEMRREI